MGNDVFLLFLRSPSVYNHCERHSFDNKVSVLRTLHAKEICPLLPARGIHPHIQLKAGALKFNRRLTCMTFSLLTGIALKVGLLFFPLLVCPLAPPPPSLPPLASPLTTPLHIRSYFWCGHNNCCKDPFLYSHAYLVQFLFRYIWVMRRE